GRNSLMASRLITILGGFSFLLLMLFSLLHYGAVVVLRDRSGQGHRSVPRHGTRSALIARNIFGVFARFIGQSELGSVVRPFANKASPFGGAGASAAPTTGKSEWREY